MNFRQVEAFRAVMLTGSVTEAGTMMSITQPAVTRLIARFEEEVGFTLFKRTHNRLVPTSEAKTLFLEVERTFLGLDQIKSAARAIQNMETGQLSIIATPMFAYGILPRIIGRFHADYPEIFVDLSLGQRDVVIESIASQRYDLAIETPPFKHPGVTEHPLVEEPAVCVLPVGHRLADLLEIHAEDLQGESFVSLPKGSMFRRQTDEVFLTNAVKRKLMVETHTQQSVCNLVATGVGVSIVGPYVMEDMAGLPLVYLPFRPVLVNEYALLSPAFRPMSTIARKFMTYVEKAMEVDHKRTVIA